MDLLIMFLDQSLYGNEMGHVKKLHCLPGFLLVHGSYCPVSLRAIVMMIIGHHHNMVT